MWLAGSFSAMSPVHNFLYLLFGSNRLPPDIFADVKCGQIEVGLFSDDGSSSLAQVSCFRTGFGEIRVRIPITRAGPTVASIGIMSMVGAPCRKCSGASIWVPVWTLRSICDSVQMSPFLWSHRRFIVKAGSPGQCTIPLRTGTVTSIQLLTDTMLARDPGSFGSTPPA